MIDQREILWGIIAPPVLMAVGMAVAASLPTARRFLSTGALLALVFGVALLGFRGWPAPGGDVHNWPAWIAFAGGLITLCSACGHGPVPWRVLVRAAITGLASWLLLWPQVQHGTTGGAMLWIAGTALVWTVVVLAWERAHAATTAGVSASAATTLAGLGAAALLLFNTMTHAQFAGILTAALAAALVFGWWRPAWYVPAGPVTVAALVLPALWLLGHRYADLPGWTLPFLLLAGTAPCLAALPRVGAWSAWKRVAIAVASTALIASPVLVWGVVTSIRAAAEPGYGY
jgi:hypothetical protein